MKKVRFESPQKARNPRMSDSECHSPRPFFENQFRACPPDIASYERILPFSADPVDRFENSNSSPYPTVTKTNANLPETQKHLFWKPSNDLDLSFLDTSFHEPRQPINKATVNAIKNNWLQSQSNSPATNSCNSAHRNEPHVLKPLENINPPNILVKDNSFFLRRDNLDKFHININPLNPLQDQLTKLSIDKENKSSDRPVEPFKKHLPNPTYNVPVYPTNQQTNLLTSNTTCPCHHCIKIPPNVTTETEHTHLCSKQQIINHGDCSHQCKPQPTCSNCEPTPPRTHNTCHKPHLPPNAVDKKTWILEKYKQNQNCNEIQKQTNISKEKREPTVADLFKIIKLQNEQLQLLQEKVDKFITMKQNPQPTITCTENVTMKADNEQVKMSIGVMTSFEMVHTSTVINKEVVKQTDNEIQCSKSQISIKEVVSKPVNLNFLDGISPVNGDSNNVQEQKEPEEKTLNEVSLYNVQVDNATTPLMSPEQTLYLEVKDYSESETDSIDQSNVGWTYYNKVMTHVNGMLQDSEMPSSASAMYRNMRQHCVQMQIDKTNVSVTKRVKFGDDPLGIHQPHIYQPSTDTSLKMKQLASKYLNTVNTVQRPPLPIASSTNIDMSFATRNYMEKHKLLQGMPSSSKPPQSNDIPRFLDITALKQQPKFL